MCHSHWPFSTFVLNKFVSNSASKCQFPVAMQCLPNAPSASWALQSAQALVPLAGPHCPLQPKLPTGNGRLGIFFPSAVFRKVANRKSSRYTTNIHIHILMFGQAWFKPAKMSSILCMFYKHERRRRLHLWFEMSRFNIRSSGIRHLQGTIGCTPNSVPMVLIGLLGDNNP